MIKKINGVTVVSTDPMHHLTGAALEQRINDFALEIIETRKIIYAKYAYMLKEINKWDDSKINKNVLTKLIKKVKNAQGELEK